MSWKANSGVDRFKFAFAAGVFAILGSAITLLIQPTFIESTVTHAVLDGLVVGMTVYIGLKILERALGSQIG